MRHQHAAVHELARIELLAGLPGEILARLAERMQRRELRPGDAFLEAEHDRGGFAVVLTGMLKLESGRLVRPGETLGGPTPAAESLQALLPSAVAWCDRATFEELVGPHLG